MSYPYLVLFSTAKPTSITSIHLHPSLTNPITIHASLQCRRADPTTLNCREADTGLSCPDRARLKPLTRLVLWLWGTQCSLLLTPLIISRTPTLDSLMTSPSLRGSSTLLNSRRRCSSNRMMLCSRRTTRRDGKGRCSRAGAGSQVAMLLVLDSPPSTRRSLRCLEWAILQVSCESPRMPKIMSVHELTVFQHHMVTWASCLPRLPNHNNSQC